MDGRIIWSPGVTLAGVEQQVIERAFIHYQGNKTQTSRALGISVRTLDERLEKYEAAKKLEEEAYERRKLEQQEYLNRARGFVPSIYPSDHEPVPSSEARIQPEPAQDIASQQPVSVQKRPEIQEVLSRHSSGNRARGGR